MVHAANSGRCAALHESATHLPHLRPPPSSASKLSTLARAGEGLLPPPREKDPAPLEKEKAPPLGCPAYFSSSRRR